MATPALHHVAFACKDLEATHEFYSGLLGLPLVHTEVQMVGDGYLKHIFYDLGDGSCIAFFYLQNAGEPAELDTAISTGLGLPIWVNHIALRAEQPAIDAVRARMEERGLKLHMKLNHGWAKSTYLIDPNGIMVELCKDDPGFVPDETEALRVLRTPVTPVPSGPVG
jgi:catechol 2,3-dioxygenase-like lactoylglutathione lyase family enzyme